MPSSLNRPGPATSIRAVAALVLLLTAPILEARAQIPDSTHLTRGRADRLAGIYQRDDGQLFHILDLRDQMEGRAVLSLTEYGTGRVRALYPLEDGGFVAGNAWFSRDPVEFRLRFDESAANAPSVRWQEADRVQWARRVQLREREVTLRNGDVTLAGTLVMPPGPGPHPAVVMIPGSGPITRRAPRQIGDLLAARGVAVLVTDKRGTGQSSGTWNLLSHRTWASDVELQLDFLKRQSEIDSTRLGLYAASEGGFVAPFVAARRPDVQFLVCRVCTATPLGPVILDLQRAAMRAQGLDSSEVSAGIDLIERLQRFAVHRTGYDSLVARSLEGARERWRAAVRPAEVPPRDGDYWDAQLGVLELDPADSYRRLGIPVFVILGEHDMRIRADRHHPIFASLRASGRTLETWVVPGANHGLLVGAGTEEGYPRDLHARIADWIVWAAGR